MDLLSTRVKGFTVCEASKSMAKQTNCESQLPNDIKNNNLNIQKIMQHWQVPFIP